MEFIDNDIFGTDLINDKPYNEHFNEFGLEGTVLVKKYKKKLENLVGIFILFPIF